MADCTHLLQQNKNVGSAIERLLRITRMTFSQSVRRRVKLCYTGLIFIDPGVKVDEIYYCDLLLSLQLRPGIHQVSGEFIFQQENAPAYTTLVFRN